MRAGAATTWGGVQERLGLACEASSGAGGRWDVGGAQQRKGANGGSGIRDSLERGFGEERLQT